MKVLHINTVKTAKNGITAVLFNLICGSENDANQDLMAINPPEKSYEEKINSAGGSIFVIERKKTRIFNYISSLKKLIEREKYDIVHIHGNSHTTVLELLAAKLAGCKVRIVHAHSTSCAHLTFHKLMAPLFNMLCTHGFACSEPAGRFMFGKRKFTVINNAVDTKKFSFDSLMREKCRAELKLNSDTVAIGHVGIINENKNQMLLVRAFADYRKVNENARLVLIGDGSERKNVENEITELNLTDKVTLLGVRTDVNELLNAFDAFTLPSHYEGLPLTAVEAQTNGLPCLISDKVTTEVDKTGNVTFLPIEDSAVWSDSFSGIKVLTDSERRARSLQAVESIKACGYDIEEETRKLLERYESFIK